MVVQCVAVIQKENRKFCLAAEGLGNRLCFLEPTFEAKVRFPEMTSVGKKKTKKTSCPLILCTGRRCLRRGINHNSGSGQWEMCNLVVSVAMGRRNAFISGRRELRAALHY